MKLFLINTLVIFGMVSLCDVCGNDIIPFTGFKILQTYRISFMPFSSSSYLEVTNCKRGKTQFSREFPLESSLDSLFNSTFCFLEHSSDEKEATKNSQKPSLFSKAKDMLGKLFYLDKNSRKNTGNDKENGVLKRTPSIREGVDQSNTKPACYKIARRRSYALTDLAFFVPYTLIGGAFQCHLTSEQRQQVNGSFKLSNIATFPFHCDPSLASPITPMVADISGKSKVDWSFSPLSVLHTIPYLKSALRLDPRLSLFSAANSSTWAQSVDVNEDYNLSKKEIASFNTASTKISNFIQRALDPPKAGLSRWFQKALPARKPEYQSMEPMSRFAMLLSSLNETSVSNYQKHILQIWNSAIASP